MQRNIYIAVFLACLLVAINFVRNHSSARQDAPPAAPDQTATEPLAPVDEILAEQYPVFEIRKLLLARDFQKLDALLDGYHRDYLRDVNAEDGVFDAYYRAFKLNANNTRELLDAWVASSPDKYQPYLARAAYNYHQGWKARGQKFASETSGSQMLNMEFLFSKVVDDLDLVLAKRQDHIIPYYLLINIHKAMGEKGKMQAVAQRAWEKCPGSFRLRSTYALAIAPRWGGNYEVMAQFAQEAQRYASVNARIKLLPGYVYYDAGNMHGFSKNYALALQFLDKAVGYGDSPLFYEERARAREKLDKLEEALADADAAIELEPQNFDLYYRKAHILGTQGRLQESLENIQIAEQFDPDDEDTQKFT